MKNVWKGLVVGGLTGVAAGVVLDMLNRGAREASAFGEKVGHQAPEVVGRIRHAVSDAIAEGAGNARNSEVVDQLKGAASTTRQKAEDAAVEGRSKVVAAAPDVKQTIESALAGGRSKAKAASADVKEGVAATR